MSIKSSERKGIYRVRNWPAYNAGLIARGRVDMWIDDTEFTSDSAASAGKRGRPRLYSDRLIQMLLTLKHVYHLTLRSVQGFVQSLRDLAIADLPVPSFTTLSRRPQNMQVVLADVSSGEPITLLVDSTGVKLYG
jgi:Transposase DDE domain